MVFLCTSIYLTGWGGNSRQDKPGVENYQSLEAMGWDPVQAGQGRQWQPCPHTVSHSQSRSRSYSAKNVARVFFFFRSWRPGCPCSRRKRRACSASRVSCKNSETPSGRSFPSRGAASRYGSLFLKPRVTTMMMVMKTMVMWTMLLQPLRKVFNFSPVAPSSPSPLVIDLPIRKV